MFDSQRYNISWEVRGPLSLVSTTEELLGRNSSGFDLENRDYGRRYPLCWPLNALYPQKLALTSPAGGGRSVGIVRSRTQATEFILNCLWALPEQSLSGPSPAALTTILQCFIRDSPNMEGQVPVFIFPRNGGPVISLGTMFPFRRLLRLAGLRWRISTRVRQYELITDWG
jgi:hypothetical protein